MSFDFNASNYFGNLQNFDLYKKGKKADGVVDTTENGKINTTDWLQGLDGNKGYGLQDLVIISSAIKDGVEVDMNGDGKFDKKDEKLLKEQQNLIRQMLTQQSQEDISDINGDGEINSKDWEAFLQLKAELEPDQGEKADKKMQQTLEQIEKKLSYELFNYWNDKSLNVKDLATLDISAKLAEYFASDNAFEVSDDFIKEQIETLSVFDLNNDGKVDQKELWIKYLDVDKDGQITDEDVKEWQIRAEQYKNHFGFEQGTEEYQKAEDSYAGWISRSTKTTNNNKINDEISQLKKELDKVKNQKKYAQANINAAYAKGKKPSETLTNKLNNYNAEIDRIMTEINNLKAKLIV